MGIFMSSSGGSSVTSHIIFYYVEARNARRLVGEHSPTTYLVNRSERRGWKMCHGGEGGTHGGAILFFPFQFSVFLFLCGPLSFSFFHYLFLFQISFFNSFHCFFNINIFIWIISWKLSTYTYRFYVCKVSM